MKRLFLFFTTMFMVASMAMGQTYKPYNQEILNKAEAGDAEAQYELGNCYSRGWGVSEDNAKAVYWWNKAAERGNAEAQEKLGVCYGDGKGVNQDFVKAVYWFGKAAEQGNANAQKSLGLCYANGWGVSQDSIKAFYWYGKAAEQKKLYSEAVYWWGKAAEQGNAEAQCELGICYYSGKGVVSKDYAKAVYWYTKAAEQGNFTAQLNLGIWHLYGDVAVSQDYEKAVYWLSKAGEQGGPNVQYSLGMMFEEKQYKDKAIYWYEKAAQADFNNKNNAQLLLASLYYNSPNIAGNYVKAVKYLTLAKESNDDEISGSACSLLSKCYRNGRGVTQDIRKADELLAEAKAKGCGGDVDTLIEKLKKEYSIAK